MSYWRYEKRNNLNFFSLHNREEIYKILDFNLGHELHPYTKLKEISIEDLYHIANDIFNEAQFIEPLQTFIRSNYDVMQFRKIDRDAFLNSIFLLDISVVMMNDYDAMKFKMLVG